MITVTPDAKIVIDPLTPCDMCKISALLSIIGIIVFFSSIRTSKGLLS